MSKEKAIQNQLLEFLELKGIYAWACQNTGIYDSKFGGYRKPGKFFKSGVSDILGVLPDGRFLAIEVKQPGKYPTTDQKEFVVQVKARGGVAFVARSLKDLDNGMCEFVPTWKKCVF